MSRKFIDNIAEENGKFYFRVYFNGKTYCRLAKGATTKAEAKKIRIAFLFRLEQQDYGYDIRDEKKIYTTKFMFNKFLTYAKGKRSYEKDVYQCRVLQKYFKEKKLADDLSKIKQKHIKELQKHLQNTPTSRGEQRAESTVNKYIACLKTAFNVLVKDEDIDVWSNPCVGVKMLTEDNRRDVYLPKELEEEFLSLLPEMVRDIIILNLSTALRIGNVIHARKCEFNMIRKVWRIPKEKNKGKKEIEIQLNNKSLNIINKYYNQAIDYLFINPVTQKHIKTFRKSFASAAKKICIPELQPKDIRRTAATWLYQKGTSLRVIRDMLHHSNISTTERYLGITNKEVSIAYDKLGD